MEYDRALYRVYERTIDELIISRRSRTSTQNVRENNNLDVNTTTNTNTNVNTNANNNPNATDDNNSHHSTPINRSDTSDENQNLFDASNFTQQNQYGANFVPFILPTFLMPCTNAVSGIISTGNWRLLMRSNNSTNATATSFRNYNNNDDGTVSTPPRSFFGTLRSSWRFSRLTTNDANAHTNNNFNNTNDNDVEMTDLHSITSTTRSPGSPSGLRRRSPREESSSSSFSDRSRSSSGSATSADEENLNNGRHPPALVVQHHNDSNISPPNSPTSATVQLAQNVASTQLEQQQQQEQQQDPNTNNSNNNRSREDNNDESDRDRSACSQKGLLLIMSLAFFIATIHLIILAILHFTYIGPRISKPVIMMMESPTTFNTRRIGDDTLKDVSDNSNIYNSNLVQMTCLEEALSTRPIEQRSKFRESATNETLITTTTTTNDNGEEQQEAHLLGSDEILQIKIIYGDCQKNSTEQTKCSRVRYIDTEKEKSLNYTETTVFEDMEEYHSSSMYWKNPTYRFSTNEALLYLENDMMQFYNMSLVNVTLTERCLNTGSDYDGKHRSKRSLLQKIAQPLAQIYGMDPIIINQLMYGIKTASGEYRNGHVYKVHSKERWSYSKKMLKYHHDTIDNLVLRFYSKIGILLISVIAFFFITSVTALIVRVLSSSGVMILFPFFSFFSAFGMRVDMRVLDYAHPWLGAARRQIGRRGLHPLNHFVYAHLSRLFLLYAMYESCQAAWSTVLYNKSVPVDLPLWIFATALVVEYFSLIYVRSALSAYFFPRYTFILFLGFHFYFHSVPYGYFEVALIPYILFMVHNILFTLLALEVNASIRGAVSLECPREVYAQLSWSEWSANLPSEWTLFLPLNSRYIPHHDRNQDDDDDDDDINDATDGDNEDNADNENTAIV